MVGLTHSFYEINGKCAVSTVAQVNIEVINSTILVSNFVKKNKKTKHKHMNKVRWHLPPLLIYEQEVHLSREISRSSIAITKDKRSSKIYANKKVYNVS